METVVVNRAIAGAWQSPCIDDDESFDVVNNCNIGVIVENQTFDFDKPFVPFQVRTISKAKAEEAKNTGYIELPVIAEIGFDEDEIPIIIKCEYIEDYFRK